MPKPVPVDIDAKTAPVGPTPASSSAVPWPEPASDASSPSGTGADASAISAALRPLSIDANAKSALCSISSLFEKIKLITYFHPFFIAVLHEMY
jgi:hypothetical protein